MATDSRTQRMRHADAQLRERTGQSLDDFLAERHRQGHGSEEIGRQLYAATGGAVQISYRTIARWVDLAAA